MTPALEIKETENLAIDPREMFQIPEEALQGAVATWHTHPSGSANLSIPDFWFFKFWHSMVHFVIYRGEVKAYAVLNGVVHHFDAEDDISPRSSG